MFGSTCHSSDLSGPGNGLVLLHRFAIKYQTFGLLVKDTEQLAHALPHDSDRTPSRFLGFVL